MVKKSLTKSERTMDFLTWFLNTPTGKTNDVIGVRILSKRGLMVESESTEDKFEYIRYYEFSEYESNDYFCKDIIIK